MNFTVCSSTDDLAIAAAIATLRVPIRPKWTVYEKRGEEKVRFELELESVDKAYRTKAIFAAVEAGTMDAGHPYLTMLRAQENRECLLDLQKQGIFCELRPVAGAPGIWEYVPGGRGLPGRKRGVEYLRTRDLKLVAALGLAGFALEDLEGANGQRTYYVRRTGPVRLPFLPIDPDATGRQWAKDVTQLPWGDPVTQGLAVLRTRDMILESMKGRGPLLIVQPPREGIKRAVVQLDGKQNASPAAMEAVARFFRK